MCVIEILDWTLMKSKTLKLIHIVELKFNKIPKFCVTTTLTTWNTERLIDNNIPNCLTCSNNYYAHRRDTKWITYQTNTFISTSDNIPKYRIIYACLYKVTYVYVNIGTYLCSVF